MKTHNKRQIALVDMIKLKDALAGLRATRAQAIFDAVILEESVQEEIVSEISRFLQHQPS
ncbi:MAG: hypothetical protein RX316_00395 [bacterium]|nr:hypothetical protein [bacterium]